MDMYFLSKLGDAVERKSICRSLEGRVVTEVLHENPAVGLTTASTASLDSQNQLPVPGVSAHSHFHNSTLRIEISEPDASSVSERQPHPLATPRPES